MCSSFLCLISGKEICSFSLFSFIKPNQGCCYTWQVLKLSNLYSLKRWLLRKLLIFWILLFLWLQGWYSRFNWDCRSSAAALSEWSPGCRFHCQFWGRNHQKLDLSGMSYLRLLLLIPSSKWYLLSYAADGVRGRQPNNKRVVEAICSPRYAHRCDQPRCPAHSNAVHVWDLGHPLGGVHSDYFYPNLIKNTRSLLFHWPLCKKDFLGCLD